MIARAGIGQALQMMRVMAGLTLEDMARSMGMSRTTYHAIEVGRRPLSLVEQERLLRQAVQLIDPASASSVSGTLTVSEPEQPAQSDP